MAGNTQRTLGDKLRKYIHIKSMMYYFFIFMSIILFLKSLFFFFFYYKSRSCPFEKEKTRKEGKIKKYS